MDYSILTIQRCRYWWIYKKTQEKGDSLKTIPISTERLDSIKELIKETNIDLQKFLQFHKLKSLQEINQGNIFKIEKTLLDRKTQLESEIK